MTASPSATAVAEPGRVRAREFEFSAFRGVWVREWVLFRRLWRSTTFSSVVEPTIYLLAFGVGLGSLITEIDGFSYVEFVGTGTVASAVLFSSIFGAMFNTFVKREFLKTYDAILATPVNVREVMAAEAAWLALRAGVYGNAPLLVAMAFGLQPTPTMVLVPFIGALTGLGFAFLGQWISAVVPSIDSFNYVTSAVVTPLFLLAGTFFPLTNFPPAVQTLAQLNPLYHCVELVRAASFQTLSPADLGHAAALAGFAVVAAALSFRWQTGKLID
jgi:lipooligosaccharide transport system permease protein